MKYDYTKEIERYKKELEEIPERSFEPFMFFDDEGDGYRD